MSGMAGRSPSMTEAMSNTIQSAHAAKKETKQYKKVAIGSVILSILFAAAMFCIVLVGNEVSKDSRPDKSSHELRSNDGFLIATGEALSYTSLFDLPSFDTVTLSKIKTLTMTLDGRTRQATFNIAGAVKEVGAQSCTLYTHEGSEIRIDASTSIAMAKVHGKTHVVDGQRRRALAVKPTARMYTEEEFFVKERGFEIASNEAGQLISRRLTATSDLYGFASVAVAVAAALLDTANMAPGASYTSILVSGTLQLISGDSAGSAAYAEVYYTTVPTNVTGSSVKISSAGTTVLSDHSLNFNFVYTNGVLTACEAVELGTDIILSSVATAASENSLLALSPTGETVFAVESMTLDPPAKPASLMPPSVDSCKVIYPPPGEGGSPPVDAPDANITDLIISQPDQPGRSLGARRQLGWGGAASDKELWYAAEVAYKAAGNAGQEKHKWKIWKVCETSNAVGKLVWQKIGGRYVMVIGLSGTNLFDFGDWFNNMDIRHKGISGGRTVHNGFWEYQNKIQGCLNHWKNTLLSSWGIGIDYVVGHSLGGASATVYCQVHGCGSRGLVTFGAPKTRVSSSCTFSGKRIFHKEDAISSKLLGVLSSFRHDLNSAYKQESYCERSCWVGCCPWGWEKRTVKEGSCSKEAGGCSNIIQCAYTFATNHLSYGDYL